MNRPSPSSVRSVVCTLFEGDYHYGVGALTNSLYAAGYRGTVYVGCRGELPPWAAGASQSDEGWKLAVAEGLMLTFLKVDTEAHLTNHKPDFMQRVWSKVCPDAGQIFYFDPDIVIMCRWEFFEEWASCGVAVCHDVNASMPDTHPLRSAWRLLAAHHGLALDRHVNSYFNAGFVGIGRSNEAFLKIWCRVLQIAKDTGVQLDEMSHPDRTRAFSVYDQDAFNIACMVSSCSLSEIGRDGMDFQTGGGGYVMSHAIGGPKPWRKRMLGHLLAKAQKPSRADKFFFQHIAYPVSLYPSPVRIWKLANLRLASALGRYLG